MYKTHPKMKDPDNPNVKIWRYMDFAKYVSLISKKALFFCRVDKLGDQNEMSLPLANKKKNIEFYKRNEEAIKKKFKGKLTLELWNNMIDITKYSVIINSWNRNEYESAAMWSSYLSSNCGIAVQSSFKRLCESFSKTSENINIGIVNYKDYQTDIIQDDTIFGFVSHKLKSYEHENEIRAIITNQVNEKNMPLYEMGKYIPVDLKVLVKSIYVAPNAPIWFKELVIETTNKFGFEFSIKTSELNDRSLY